MERTAAMAMPRRGQRCESATTARVHPREKQPNYFSENGYLGSLVVRFV